jgi:hypothetical protein
MDCRIAGLIWRTVVTAGLGIDSFLVNDRTRSIPKLLPQRPLEVTEHGSLCVVRLSVVSRYRFPPNAKDFSGNTVYDFSASTI